MTEERSTWLVPWVVVLRSWVKVGWGCSSDAASHLLPHADAAAVQRVDVLAAAVREAADEAEVAEDDAGHLGDVLLAVVVADVAAVVHQAGHQVALAQLLGSAFFNLAIGGTEDT